MKRLKDYELEEKQAVRLSRCYYGDYTDMADVGKEGKLNFIDTQKIERVIKKLDAIGEFLLADITKDNLRRAKMLNEAHENADIYAYIRSHTDQQGE